MSQPTFSFDQVQVLLAVVDAGSFSGAARRLNRAQSAVTYAVQRLEEQLGTPLFDRSAYRPALTEAGRMLLPRMQRIADEMRSLGDQARGIARGLEPELTLVVEAIFPMCALLDVLRAFGQRFPSVPPRIYVGSMGGATELVLDGTATLGLLSWFGSEFAPLQRQRLMEVTLIPVAAPGHPLGQIDRPISRDELGRHVQLVLTDRSGLTGARDYGVLSSQTWRLADLGAKHTMLVAGFGWGSMPAHLVADDLAAGRLRRLMLAPDAADEVGVTLALCSAYRRDRPPGPAGRWLLEHLGERMEIAGAAPGV